MTMDAIIMMIITVVGYIGGFSYFMIRVFKKEKIKQQDKNILPDWNLISIREDIFMALYFEIWNVDQLIVQKKVFGVF